jgi:hypothetical protein
MTTVKAGRGLWLQRHRLGGAVPAEPAAEADKAADTGGAEVKPTVASGRELWRRMHSKAGPTTTAGQAAQAAAAARHFGPYGVGYGSGGGDGPPEAA